MGSYVFCAAKISENSYIFGNKQGKLVVYNTFNKMTTHTLSSGSFMSICKVTDNSFIAMAKDRIQLIHQLDTFIITEVDNKEWGWVTNDGLQIDLIGGTHLRITFVDNNGGFPWDKEKRNIRRITIKM